MSQAARRINSDDTRKKAPTLREDFETETVEHGKIILVGAPGRCQVISEHQTARAAAHTEIL
jgi:hypothetical protein